MKKIKGMVKLTKDAQVYRTITEFKLPTRILFLASINGKIHAMEKLNENASNGCPLFKPIRPLSYEEMILVNPYFKKAVKEG